MTISSRNRAYTTAPPACKGVEFALEVSEERGTAQRLTADLFHEILSIDGSANGMNVLPQPAEQRLHITTRHMLLRRADFSSHRFAQLGTDQVAQKVRGEVPERAVGPVHVLEDALLVRLRDDAEELSHLSSPQIREFGDVDGAPDCAL